MEWSIPDKESGEEKIVQKTILLVSSNLTNLRECVELVLLFLYACCVGKTVYFVACISKFFLLTDEHTVIFRYDFEEDR